MTEAIKGLNPRVKQVITMRFLGNLSRSEIAKQLNISEDDVHTYQKRGVKYLKNMVERGKVSPHMNKYL
jgi:RNA polymerase sigma factor (sigma-70 family)